MAESSASNNDQGLSATDYADLQHIGSQLPQNHPMRAKINAVLSASQPNAGLAGPSVPGPVEKVAPTEGPIARSLTALEAREADVPKSIMRPYQESPFTPRTPNMFKPGPIIQGAVNQVVDPEARQRFSEGDIAGGVGDVGANLLNMEVMRRAGGGEPIGEKMTPENMAAPVRGTVKGLNAAKRNAPAIGAGLGAVGGAGELVGKGSPYGLLYMPYVGERLGKFIQKAPDIPGERFGLPTEPAAAPLPASEGGTVSRGTTIGASRTGAVPSPEQFIGNPTTTRPEAVSAPSKFAGGKFEPAEGPIKGTPSGPPPAVGKYQPPERNYPMRGPIQGPQQETAATGPIKADVSKLGPPSGVGKYQPPERIPPPVRTAPIERTPTPVETPSPQVSMADQIATAKGLGFKNLSDAINRFGFDGWQKILGQNAPTPEPPSVRPGSLTPFHSDSPLTPTDLGMVRNTRIPTWDEVERQGAKERFYAQAPMVKTKTQLVNEVQPSMVAKSEANTSPYADNLPTKKIRK